MSRDLRGLLTLLLHFSERDAETSGQTKASSTVLSRRDLESGAWGELHFQNLSTSRTLIFLQGYKATGLFYPAEKRVLTKPT